MEWEEIEKWLSAGIKPCRVSSTVGGGVCFYFVNGCKRMYLECHDDGEIGYIVEDYIDKRILANRKIIREEIFTVLKDFYEKD